MIIFRGGVFCNLHDVDSKSPKRGSMDMQTASPIYFFEADLSIPCRVGDYLTVNITYIYIYIIVLC